ncbi:hypothetical protein HUW63_08330 [Myxococcus sp. AM001]|nr:hypothetical protein [Myxococcus sp. AM001]
MTQRRPEYTSKTTGLTYTYELDIKEGPGVVDVTMKVWRDGEFKGDPPFAFPAIGYSDHALQAWVESTIDGLIGMNK